MPAESTTASFLLSPSFYRQDAPPYSSLRPVPSFFLAERSPFSQVLVHKPLLFILSSLSRSPLSSFLRYPPFRCQLFRVFFSTNNWSFFCACLEFFAIFTSRLNHSCRRTGPPLVIAHRAILPLTGIFFFLLLSPFCQTIPLPLCIPAMCSRCSDHGLFRFFYASFFELLSMFLRSFFLYPVSFCT